MKRGKCILITIFNICLLGISFFISSCSLVKPKIKRDLSYWQNNDYSEFEYGSKRLESFLPKYNGELKYTNAEFYYHQGCLNFDYADEAYCLELDFSQTEYIKSKESIEQNYTFLTEISLEYENLALDNFKIGDYDVRLVDSSDPRIRFPSEIEIIAFNESENRIRYCYIIYVSLDYLENEADLKNWIIINLKIGW